MEASGAAANAVRSDNGVVRLPWSRAICTATAAKLRGRPCRLVSSTTVGSDAIGIVRGHHSRLDRLGERSKKGAASQTLCCDVL